MWGPPTLAKSLSLLWVEQSRLLWSNPEQAWQRIRACLGESFEPVAVSDQLNVVVGHALALFVVAQVVAQVAFHRN